MTSLEDQPDVFCPQPDLVQYSPPAACSRPQSYSEELLIHKPTELLQKKPLNDWYSMNARNVSSFQEKNSESRLTVSDQFEMDSPFSTVTLSYLNRPSMFSTQPFVSPAQTLNEAEALGSTPYEQAILTHSGEWEIIKKGLFNGMDGAVPNFARLATIDKALASSVSQTGLGMWSVQQQPPLEGDKLNSLYSPQKGDDLFSACGTEAVSKTEITSVQRTNSSQVKVLLHRKTKCDDSDIQYSKEDRQKGTVAIGLSSDEETLGENPAKHTLYPIENINGKYTEQSPTTEEFARAINDEQNNLGTSSCVVTNGRSNGGPFCHSIVHLRTSSNSSASNSDKIEYSHHHLQQPITDKGNVYEEILSTSRCKNVNKPPLHYCSSPSGSVVVNGFGSVADFTTIPEVCLNSTEQVLQYSADSMMYKEEQFNTANPVQSNIDTVGTDIILASSVDKECGERFSKADTIGVIEPAGMGNVTERSLDFEQCFGDSSLIEKCGDVLVQNGPVDEGDVCQDKTAHFTGCTVPVNIKTGELGETRETNDRTIFLEANPRDHNDSGTPKKKILPLRSKRGVRLEAIVQRITPSRSKAVGAIGEVTDKRKPSTSSRQSLRRKASWPMLQETSKKRALSAHEQETKVQKSSIKQESSRKMSSSIALGNSEEGKESGCNGSTSTETTLNSSIVLCCKMELTPTVELEKMPTSVCARNAGKSKPERVRSRKRNLSQSVRRQPSRSRSSLERDASQQRPTGNKKKGARQRGKQKRLQQPPALFFSNEPEIHLKYVNYKAEERRDTKVDSFLPYVKVELKNYSVCTVINYPEEEKVSLKKKLYTLTSQSYSASAVPSSSYLLMGRINNDSNRKGSLVCCLCMQSTNAGDLGDLFGPYYLDGFKPEIACRDTITSIKLDNDSDTDTLWSFPEKDHSHSAGILAPRSSRLSQELVKDVTVTGQRGKQTRGGDALRSPARKIQEPSLEDWYSPPVVSLQENEFWVHEECVLWCTGVYLVKGRLYGLPEAVTLAQETICSNCHRSGASLGCYFKGCPFKYHYPCVLEAGCFLNEDNFSIRCVKHKKTEY
ncbi:uncharacterized protein SI:DKEY-94L16.4 isoform X2 [Latimeria chalumnae]|uniref:uncharacterized protein SI:DKEY-94L16.4 isoform X2 n=1 Tax=Latimeria chalumnae TaxID=7897 RepID=UPI0003C1A750|nr:PREDICTED: uncharacterized protein LOC102364747 isoform X2 [Latimeria chalumnae]|eukprot:XP_006006687.1 PREDICTED: uncharacterized protein LOC102364747 isoform X2 [Latimeria chalumnae]